MAPEHTADLAEIKAALKSLIRVVGEESEDGKSGTGLVGEVRRASAELAALKSLKDRGFGLVLGVLLIGMILVGGVKQTFATVTGLLK